MPSTELRTDSGRRVRVSGWFAEYAGSVGGLTTAFSIGKGTQVAEAVVG